ncbi:MAG: FecR domain-containing protein [Candidatus Eremiobacteraeota bacterium]|nr:FecR domain-containing protein [Candidatus Eremiobacteraeota bacterium]MBC5826266.1 FecR domain-containing protein [Candidatus Eremiobacteraeota bacterium]
MECSEALDLLYSSFDGQVTPTEQALLDAHRRMCFSCAANLVKAERFQELLRHVPQLTVPRGLEQRILNRVAGQTSGAMFKAAKVRSIASGAQRHWRGLSMAGAALAAAFAIFIVAHGTLQDLGTHRPARETVTAVVRGSLEDIGPDSKVGNVIGSSIPISSGETLRNTSAAPATVAITPHLAVTIDAASQIRFLKVHTNADTSVTDIIDVHLDRGSVRVRESLHKDASAIHLATDQATMVPTGTVFAVAKSPGMTHLTVSSGKVAVFTPSGVFNVAAGQGVRVARGAVLRDRSSQSIPH